MNDANVALVVPIVGMMIPMVIVPTVLILKHARRERELEHAERMKALELGRTLPQDESWWSPARICVMLGAGVPLGVFLCAWVATESLGVHDVIWYAATVVGFGGVVSGSFLGARYFQYAREQAEIARVAKPVPDADAFDFAGRRG